MPLCLAAVSSAEAQLRVRAETGVVLVAVGTTPAQWTAGVERWWRTAPRTRLGGVVAGGLAGERAAARGELAAHFLLNPHAAEGVGWYAGGGVAGTLGAAEGVWLVAVLGVEARPGGRRGWFVEGGVGGGVRVAAGWRWRSGAPR